MSSHPGLLACMIECFSKYCRHRSLIRRSVGRDFLPHPDDSLEERTSYAAAT